MNTLYKYITHTPYGSGNYEFIIGDNILCNGEEYLENPMATAGWEWKATNDDTGIGTISAVSFSGDRACFYPEMVGSGEEEYQRFISYGNVQFRNEEDEPIGGIIPMSFTPYTYVSLDYMHAVVNTNIPIFLDEDIASQYYNEEDQAVRLQLIQQHAINYGMNEPPSNIYEFISYSVIGEWTENGVVNQPDTVLVKGFRLKMADGEKVSLFNIPGRPDNELRYGISRSSTPLAAYYTYDGVTWQQMPGQPYELPFNYVWRGRELELGTFRYAYSYNSNDAIPLWDTEEDADAYNRGEKDITDATNWDIISGKFPIGNETGEELVETEFGEVKTQGFFSQQYVLNATCLAALANDLYDTSAGGIWEDIKKGLDMYGANPMDAVMGLSFWPVNINEVFTTASAPYVWFGGYGWEPSAGSANRILYPNGYKTLGSLTIKRSFNSWRDFSPYTRLYVSLPYCGKYELDLTRYYGKSVEVRYYFDTRTNGCIACLIANGHLMDYFNGNCATSMSITLTDFSSYANTQMQTLLGFGGQAASTGINAASSAGQLAAAGTGAAALGIAGAGVAGAAIGAKAVYGLSQNNINKFNVTKGGSSSMLNQYLPQYVEFIFEIQEDCAPPNYGQLYGYPSMKSGSVGSFSGFLKCQSVKLNCANATEAERNEIKQLLMSGIYI